MPASATDQLLLDLGAAAPRAPIDLRPMLPRAVAELPSDGRHLRDLHWGGLRTLAHLGPDGARLIVGGRDVSVAFPEVVAALARGAPPGTILDGELVVPDASGRLDRRVLRGRLRGSTAAASATATLVVSDLPWLAGLPLLAQPLRVRRERLAALQLVGDHLVVLAPLAGAADSLLAVIRERGIEGVTAKRLDSPYLPGVRSRLWRLARATVRSSVLRPFDEAVAPSSRPLLALLRTLPFGEEP